MSLLVNEFSMLLERVLVVADTNKRLKSLFEQLSMEITTDLSPHHRVDLRNAGLPEVPPAKFFTAFNLGRRGTLDLRLMMMGLSLEEGQVDELFWDTVDHVVIDLDPEDKASEALLACKVPERARKTPCVLRGTGAAEAKENLREKAIVTWASRNFNNLYLSKENTGSFLAKGMEWAMSF